MHDGTAVGVETVGTAVGDMVGDKLGNIVGGIEHPKQVKGQSAYTSGSPH